MVYDVRLANTGYTCMDYVLVFLQFVTFLCTVTTVTILIINTRKQYKSEKMNLFITPKETLANCVNEIFFLYLSFTNESSLPISILDITLEIPKEGYVTDSSTGKGGTSLVFPVQVSKSILKFPNPEIIKYDALSSPLPFTIKPLNSSGGYIAFHAGGYDADILCHKTVILHVRTSRESFDVEMFLDCDNFYEFSYRHDGTVFGKACGNN